MPDERNNSAALIDGPVGPKLFNMAWPMLIGFLSMTLYNFADRYFVGKLGTEALAAMQYITPVVMVIFSITFGLSTGVSAVVSRAIGSGDMRRVRELTCHSLILAVSVVIIFVLLGLATMDDVFRALGASEDVLPLVKQYMRVWYVGMIFLVVPILGNSIIRATGNTTMPAIIMLVGTGLNVILDPLLIFGLWGLPEMGIVGAALATVIGRAVTLVMSLLVLRYRERLLGAVAIHAAALWRSWRSVLFVGLPSCVTNLLMAVSGGVLTRLARDHFGEAAVGAIGVGYVIMHLPTIVFWALISSIIPFVGQNAAAGRPERVRRVLALGQRFALIWGLISCAVLAALARVLAGAFSDDPAVIEITTRFLWVVPLAIGVQGLGMLASAAFSALHRPMSAATLNVSRMIVQVGAAAVGAGVWRMWGFFGGMVVADVVMGALAAVWIWRAACGLPAEPAPGLGGIPDGSAAAEPED